MPARLAAAIDENGARLAHFSAGYSYVNLWAEADEPPFEPIKAFWLDQRALDPVEITDDRVRQVVMIAQNEANDLVGLSSVYREYNAWLENHFYYLRTFVATDARGASVARDLTLYTRDHLVQMNESQDPSMCAGIYMEVEHVGLRQAMYARNRSLHFNYVGKNAAGNHMRVYYFDNALAPQN